MSIRRISFVFLVLVSVLWVSSLFYWPCLILCDEAIRLCQEPGRLTIEHDPLLKRPAYKLAFDGRGYQSDGQFLANLRPMSVNVKDALCFVPTVQRLRNSASDASTPINSPAGSSIQIPYLLPAVLTIGVFVLQRSRRNRKNQNDQTAKCCRCGYDLNGNQSGICPECGNLLNAPP